jgi:GAF domain-containing protein
MTDRSTSWFDREELRSLFKRARPDAPGGAPLGSRPEGGSPVSGEIASRPLPPVPPVAPAGSGPESAWAESEAGDFQEGAAPIHPPPIPRAAAEDAASEVEVEPEPDFQVEILRRHVGALVHLTRNQAAARGPLPARLSDITETAADVLGVSRAAVFTFDADRSQIVCQDLYRRGEQIHESGLVQSAADYPLYFAALKSERPMAAQDASRDPRTREFEVSYLDTFGIRSMLDVPIMNVGRMVGLLRLEQVGEPHAWEPAEEELASALAALASLAFEAEGCRQNEAEALQNETRLRAQVTALMRVARAESLGRGDLDRALRQITETAAESLIAERTGVWLYSPDYASLYGVDVFSRTTRTHERGQQIRKAACPVYFGALRGGGFIAAHDAQADPRLRELVQSELRPRGIASRLEAPIRIFGRTAGMLVLEHVGPPRHWRLDEESLAGSLADFVALVIATCERKQSDQELEDTLGEMAARAAVSVPSREGEAPKEQPPAERTAPNAPPESIPETVALPAVTVPAAPGGEAPPAAMAPENPPTEPAPTPPEAAAPAVEGSSGESETPPPPEEPVTFEEDMDDEPKT